MEKNEITTQLQQIKLTKLTSINLPENKVKLLTLYYGTKKVKDYNAEELKTLFKFILALCKLIGVTEPPEQQIVLLLIEHIQEHHKDFSAEEIKTAFSLATAGRLNFEFRHYNRLTPQIISHVLNKYKELRSKDIIEYENKLSKEKREKEQEDNIPSPKELLDSQIITAIDFFKDYKDFKSNKRSDKPMDWGNYTYSFLKKLNLIEHSKEDIETIRKEAKLELSRELHKKKRAVKISEILSNDESFEVIRMCRTISLDKYCNLLIEKNLDIGKLISISLGELQKKGDI
jgi:hypothetical protein